MQFKLDRSTRLHLIVIVVATFIAFGIILSGYFIADDTWQLQFCYRVFHGEWTLVTQNFVRSYLSLPSMDFYRPLLGITYLIDYAIYGLSAAGFYFTNLLLAALSAVLLYFVARAVSPHLGPERSGTFAFLGALLFAVSPLHCEDICWISGRADLLAAPFFFGGILAAIYARDWKSGKINKRMYVVSLAVFALSLMSKESAVTLPLVVASLFVLRRELSLLSPLSFLPLAENASPMSARSNGKDLDQQSGTENSDGKDQLPRKKKKKKSPAATENLSPASGKKTDENGNNSVSEKAESPVVSTKVTSSPAVAAPETFDWPSFIKSFVLFLSPYGLFTVIYLLVRQKALGSFVGGYTGDMGEALSKWLIFRWFDPLNLFRMAFPLAKESFHTWHIKIYQTPSIGILGTIYAIILSLFLVRLLTQKLQWRLIFFLLLWLLASLVPLIKLWGLDSSLHNQRVLYLYTAPMVMLLPALLYLPPAGSRPAMQKQMFVLTPAMDHFIAEFTPYLFYAMTAFLAVFSALTSYNWVLAGKQVQAIHEKSVALIDGLKDQTDKKVLLVRLPKDYLGAHVLMGGVNMLELLEPPFTEKSISDHMVGFQRALVGPGEPVNEMRLKMELSMLKKPRAYFWETSKTDFKAVDYDPPDESAPQSIELPVATSAAQAGETKVWYPDTIKKSHFMKLEGAPGLAFQDLKPEGGEGLVISGLDINPLAYDYINVTVSMPHVQEASGIYVTFDDCEDAKQPFAEQPQVCKLLHITKVPTGGVLRQTAVNIKVSHYGDWYSYKRIKRLKISFSNIDAIGVSRISISDDRKLTPRFFVAGRVPRACGEYFCDQQPVKFFIDTGDIKDAKNCLVEISKVNQSWDTFLTEEVNGKDNVVSRSCRVPLVNGRAFLQIDPQYYAENGFYDLRTVAVNDKNEMISDWSDLVTLYRPDPKGSRAAFCPDY